MALDKAILTLPFVQGMDTLTDAKLAVRPAQVVNGVFRRGTLTKRHGRKSYTRSVFGGGAFTFGEGVAAYEDTLLNLFDGGAYSYARNTGNWVNLNASAYQGVTYTDTLRVEGLANPSGFVYGGDWARVGDVLVAAYATTDGLVPRWYVDVYDARTMTLYNQTVTEVPGAEVYLRCVALRDAVLIIGKIGTAMYRGVVTLATPASFGSFTTFGAAAWAPGGTDGVGFDAFAYTPELAVVVYPVNGTDMRLTGLNAAGTVVASPAATTVAAVAGANGLQSGIVATRDTPGNIYVFYGDFSAGSTRYFVRNAAFGAVLAPTDIVTTGNWSGLGANFRRGVTWEPSSGVVWICMDGQSSAQWLGAASVTSAGVANAFYELDSTQRMRIVCGGGAFKYGRPIVACTVGNTVTPYVCLIDAAEGTVRAQGLLWDGGASSATLAGRYLRVVPRAMMSESDTALEFLVFQRTRTAYTSFAGAVRDVTPQAMVRLTMKDASAGALQPRRLGQTLYFPGALPRIYDGKAVVPTGLPNYPVMGATSTAGVGAVDAGVHQYKLVWAWVSHRGELVRSPASPATSVTAPGGTGIILDVYTDVGAIRDMLQDGLQVYLEVYRTQAGRTVFYRSSINAVAPQLLYYNEVDYPGTTAGFVRLTDAITDAALSAGELLYASGGVLDWQAPPAHSYGFVHQRRYVACGLENPFAWIASSEYREGECVRFNQLTAASVPADTGPIVGGASLDGKLVLLTTQAAYFTLGEGPDLLGQNPWPAVQRIASVDGGCVSPGSIVETPLGVMFQSSKGIQLLDRGLNCTFVGADVSAYSTGEWVVSSAILDAANYEVRFIANSQSDIIGQVGGMFGTTSNGGKALVYNYLNTQSGQPGTWSVFDDYGAQSQCFYDNALHMVRSDGLLRREDMASRLDDGEGYSLLVETSWLKPSQALQGVQRVWYVSVLGVYGSDVTIHLDVAYDYEGTSPDVASWSVLEDLDGAGVYTLEGPFQLRQHVGHRAQAYKFRIYETDVRGSGEGLSLTDMALEVGVKRGLFKLPAAKTM